MQNNKGQEEKEKFIMKKLLASLMALSMVFAVTGCSESNDSENESKAEAKTTTTTTTAAPAVESKADTTTTTAAPEESVADTTTSADDTTSTATRLKAHMRMTFTQAICILSRSTQRSGQCRSPLVLT